MMRALLLLLIATSSAHAAPLLINYQGALDDPELPPIANVEMEFRLWANAAPTAGEPLLWGRRYQVRVDDQQFHVILGSDGLPNRVADAGNNDPMFHDLDLALANGGRFLGITVIARDAATGDTRGDGIELLPRQELLSVPHAVASERLAGGLSESEETALTMRPRFAYDTGELIIFDATESAVVAQVDDFPVRAGALLKVVYRGTVFFDSPAIDQTCTINIHVVDDLGGVQTVRSVEAFGNHQMELTNNQFVYFEWVGDVDNDASEVTRSVEISVDGVNGARIEAGIEHQLLTVEEILNGRVVPEATP